jgi:poly(3-hydroxyalkanoate) synthetase
MAWEDWTRHLWDWPLASLEMWRRALEPGDEATAGRPPPPWTTPARLTLELASMRLWDFSTARKQRPAVILSPFALHDAQIADLAPGHSIVATLLRHGCRRLYLIEWKSATPATRLETIDDLLAALNVAVDDLGAPVDLVGLCQGGWLSLLYAARFPAKVSRIVLAGAPVDVAAEASALSEPVKSTCDDEIRRLIDLGGGCVKGERMAPLWPREDDSEKRLIDALEIEPPFSAPRAARAAAAFREWDRRTLDLPGPYFHEVFRHLFRDNLLAKGGFPALGRPVDLAVLRHPLFLLIGEKDAIAPPAQALAVTRLTQGAAETAQAPCGHLALFMGRKTIAREWPRVAAWLTKAEAHP